MDLSGGYSKTISEDGDNPTPRLVGVERSSTTNQFANDEGVEIANGADGFRSFVGNHDVELVLNFHNQFDGVQSHAIMLLF